jgi:LacI family transcriptional regulator
MLSPPVGDVLPRMLTGALRVADERRWDFYPVTCNRKTDGQIIFERSPGGGTLEELLGLLRPDGIILTLDVIALDEFRAAARAAGLVRQLPIVHLGEPASLNSAVYAHGDARSFAEMALRELLRFGFDDFAFAPFHRDLPWSRSRGEAFAHLVALAGKRFHGVTVTARASADSRTPVSADILEPWLASLPKPCGIFAANDVTGEAVLRVARRLKLDVPGEIAVIGVDDNANLCDHTHPTLSSVRRDLEGEGRAAAELLAEWMAYPSRPPKPRAVPAVSLVRRFSTRLSWQRDRRVARAEEWIRLHACDAGLSPRDVVREMGVSRTTADRLFRTMAERTILEEIQTIRIARAQEKLRTGTAPDIVAAECGFASTLDFRRVFRKIVGQPVGAWTKTV